MIKGKAISITTFVSLLIATAAGVITIGQFGFHLWEPFGNRTSIESPVPPVTSTATTTPVVLPVTLTPTHTPTPVPPLDRQLEEALSVTRSSARSVALLIVAQDAVLERDYWTAIRAASATSSSSAQAKNLAFVVECAIEDSLYDFAAEAADKVKYTSDRDRLKINAIEARRRATSEATPIASEAMPSAVDRESMACFNSVS